MTAVFAHRGASAQWPENTVAAFEAAGALGATGVELDVRPGRDAALVVLHDARLPDGRPVAEVAAEALPASVCLLPAALVACGDLRVNVELKADHPAADAAFVDAVVEVVLDWGGRALLSSFDEATIDRCHRVAPDLPTAQLTWMPEQPFADLLAGVRQRGHVAWHPHHLLVDAATMASARGAELEVNTWTVDDPSRMVELAALGVDGIVTNDVAVAVQVLG